MFIALNGPIGIGKSTLAEALTESIAQCAMLNGDSLLELNPPVADETDFLHTLLVVLIAHYQRSGYRHFVIDHFWRLPEALSDLRSRLFQLDPSAQFRPFLLTLAQDEHKRRLERRLEARDQRDREFELRCFAEERALLTNADVGERFDVSGPLPTLVARLRQRIGL